MASCAFGTREASIWSLRTGSSASSLPSATRVGRRRFVALRAPSLWQGSSSVGACEELESVAPRVLGEEPADPRKLLIPANRGPGILQAPGDSAQPGRRPTKCGMSFTGGRERLRNPNVQLPVTERKPHSTASPERRRLLEFEQANQSAVEPPRVTLAGRRGGNLHMVQEGWVGHGWGRYRLESLWISRTCCPRAQPSRSSLGAASTNLAGLPPLGTSADGLLHRAVMRAAAARWSRHSNTRQPTSRQTPPIVTDAVLVAAQ